jgi:tetratricopeptide (TPR) repeat protein
MITLKYERVDMAVQAFHLKKYVQAKLRLADAIHKNPEIIENYILLGEACFHTEAYQDALKYLSDYLKRSENDFLSKHQRSRACDLIGQCYEKTNNDLKATSYYKLATQIDPLYASAWYNLGLILTKSAENYSQDKIDNAFKSAIQYYYQALNACTLTDPLKHTVKTTLTECLAQYGHHLYKAEKYTNAQKYYSQTIKLDPDHLIALNQLGMCSLKKEMFAEARGYFAEIISRTHEKQEHADAWFNIAHTYYLQNNWRKAANALREAKKLAPNDAHILQEEQRLRDLVSTTFFTTGKFSTLFQNKNHEETESSINDHLSNFSKP